jgi:hypothetical protein
VLIGTLQSVTFAVLSISIGASNPIDVAAPSFGCACRNWRQTSTAEVMTAAVAAITKGMLRVRNNSTSAQVSSRIQTR